MKPLTPSPGTKHGQGSASARGGIGILRFAPPAPRPARRANERNELQAHGRAQGTRLRTKKNAASPVASHTSQTSQLMNALTVSRHDALGVYGGLCFCEVEATGKVQSCRISCCCCCFFFPGSLALLPRLLASFCF